MLGVPVGFEMRIDLAVDDENAGRAFCDPRLYRLEVGERAHRRAARAIAAGDGREIRFRELHDVDRKTLAAEIMHLGRVRTVVIDEDAHAQAKANGGFQIGNRHQEAAVASAEHRELARVRDGKTDGRGEPKAYRLERMAQARSARV